MAHHSNRPAAMSATLLAAGLIACGNSNSPPPADTATGASSPPTLLNEELPVAYPGTLWARGIGGEVTLKLFVDSTGAVVPDSTRVEGSSGEPQLDAAALRGVPEMRFSPALIRGRPVSSTLLVPVLFNREAPADSGAVADSTAPGEPPG
ncbi:MAG TPA: energy transducer TonB [Gemmatimonadales bacterium]|nr:energy transducer TonB [Gemmatimonadales bacterium]